MTERWDHAVRLERRLWHLAAVIVGSHGGRMEIPKEEDLHPWRAKPPAPPPPTVGRSNFNSLRILAGMAPPSALE